MENIKEELRQMIKDKILSTIMEGKKSVHPPRGPKKPKSKTWSGKVKSGSEEKKERREGKKQAAGMYEASGPSDGQILTGLIEKEAKKLADKPKSTPRGPSVDIKDLKVSDLLSRYKSLMMKNKKA